MTPRNRPSEQGFTLLELMVSLAILAFMMVVAYSTTSATADAKIHIEEVNQRNHELRVAMAQIVRDFSHAYLSANEEQAMNERRTLFVGEPGGSVDELRFSTIGHRRLWANSNESEQSLVAYYSAADPEESGKENLVRRESRRLSNEPWRSEPAEVDVLMRDIQSVKFEYYDWRDDEWKERWNTTQADAQRGRLPTRVRITVIIETPSGKEFKLSTQARVFLEEEFKFFAN